jgi:hypothetical protein
VFALPPVGTTEITSFDDEGLQLNATTTASSAAPTTLVDPATVRFDMFDLLLGRRKRSASSRFR